MISLIEKTIPLALRFLLFSFIKNCGLLFGRPALHVV
jgi:hypothetical protein